MEVNTIELTPLQARQLREHGACVVPGETSSEVFTASDGAPAISVTFVTPQEWLDAAVPCERPFCFKGRLLHPHEPHVDMGACPDCRDGRKVIELRVKCGACWSSTSEIGPGSYHRCNNGFVSLGRYTVELLPVYDTTDIGDDDDYIVAAYDDAGDWIEMDRSSGVPLWWHSDRLINGVYCTPLPFNPLPVPGRDMVAVLTKVGES